LQFSIFQLSHIGGREDNEDRSAYSRTAQSLLLVVADGMGGHLHGEVAAEVAVQSLTESFQREARPRLVDPTHFLARALMAAHDAITERAIADWLPDIPGTTCVACVIQDGSAVWAHAGDSRLYLVRAGQILRRTQDHSLARQLIDLGDLSEEDLAELPGRNVIYSCLGGHRAPEVETSPSVPLELGDSLLLCSDGFWGPLADDEIARALTSATAGQALAGLARLAENRAGAQSDNVTGLAVRWGVSDAHGRPAPAGRTVLVGNVA
jgi:PPM family protein phosphatase